jgi:hypothetical protein
MSVRLNYVSEAELTGLHDNLAAVFCCAGLTDDSLDRAIAAALFPCLAEIEADRKREVIDARGFALSGDVRILFLIAVLCAAAAVAAGVAVGSW